MKSLRYVMTVAVLCGLIVAPSVAAAKTVKIGVLAKNGPVKALKMWKATGDYLNGQVTGHTFEIVPLGFDAVNPAIDKG